MMHVRGLFIEMDLPDTEPFSLVASRSGQRVQGSVNVQEEGALCYDELNMLRAEAVRNHPPRLT
jgi:hypothetical protein